MTTRPVVEFVAHSALGGVTATLFMDVGSALGRAIGLTAGVAPKIIGKWFMYLLRGQLIHADIVSSPPIAVAMPAVLVIHYCIGIALAALFAALRSPGPERGTVSFALGFGLMTTALAWFVMYPAMGWGIAGTRGPEELLLARTSLFNHALYGLGLALWASLLAPRFFPAAP